MIRQLIFALYFLLISYDTIAEEKSSQVSASPTIRLNNGYEIPIVGLGTYETKPTDTERIVKDAIDIGYRHIDTAYRYGNEKEVGNAIRDKIDEGVIKREDIFVTTKLWSTFHEPYLVRKAFLRSLENLNISYIDLYLIHNPMAFGQQHKDGSDKIPNDIDEFSQYPKYENGSLITSDIDYVNTWQAMEALVDKEHVRSIGISNFNSEQVERINSIAKIKPVTNQVECHPNLNQRKLIAFCAARNITTTAYSPLGRPHVAGELRLALRDPTVKQLAEKYNKTPAQIVLRYTVQNGAIVIPKSTKKQHMQENLNIFDFNLSDSDMDIMHGINSNTRTVTFDIFADHKNYPFKIEF